MNKLLQDLEDARNNGQITNNDILDFNKSGALRINTSTDNVNKDALNKTGENFAGVVGQVNKDVNVEIFDAANKQTDITKAANAIKTKRSDDTREELLKATGDFKDKQDDRYKEVDDIVDRQKNIANRQANITAAKAGRYGDIYSDGEMANIKNNIINKYGTNILNAEQYALNTNRTIDNDLLNVGIKEVADKDKRDAFKDVLLDKENSYMLNAVKEASEGNKAAIKEVGEFYKKYISIEANNESQRSENTERRAGFENEYNSLGVESKANMLRDLTYNKPGFSLVTDRIPELINTYPNLTLDEIKSKIIKSGELALTAKQQIAPIIAKPEEDRTDQEKDLLSNYLNRGLEEQKRADRHISETIVQKDYIDKGEIKTEDRIYDNTPRGKEVLNKDRQDKINSNANKQKTNSSNRSTNSSNRSTNSSNRSTNSSNRSTNSSNRSTNSSNRSTNSSSKKITILSKDKSNTLAKKLNDLKSRDRAAYNKAIKKLKDGLANGTIVKNY